MKKTQKLLVTVCRYFLGTVFLLSGIVNFPSIFAILSILTGITIMPIFYIVFGKYLALFKNEKLLKKLPIFLPLLLFFISAPFSPAVTTENNNTPKLSNITITNAPVQMDIGDTVVLALVTNITDYDLSKLEWKSSNSDVVSVNKGTIIGQGEGTARITVSGENKVSTFIDLVVQKKLQLIELKSVELNVEVGTNFDPLSNLSSSSEGVNVTSDVNTDKIGSYTVIYKTNDDEKTMVVHVKDTAPPVIETSFFYSLKGKTFSPKDFVVTSTDFSEITYKFVKTPDFNKVGSDQAVDIIATDASNNQFAFVGHYTVLDNVDDYYKYFYLSRSPDVLGFYPFFFDAVNAYSASSEEEFVKVMNTYILYVNRLGDVPYVSKYKTVDVLIDEAMTEYLWGIDRVYQGLKKKSTIWVTEGYAGIDRGIDLLWDCADEIERIYP